MKRINLRSFYRVLYPHDTFIVVPDDVANMLNLFIREEHAYYERRRAHSAFYSLDDNRMVDQAFMSGALSPYDILANDLDRKELLAAIMTLPEKQIRRVYAHFFEGLSFTEIAQMEGVHVSSVHGSIQKALKKLQKALLFCQEPPEKQ